MTTVTRLLGFAAACLAVFLTAYGVARLDGSDTPPPAGHDGHATDGPHGAAEGWSLDLADSTLEPGEQRLVFSVLDDGEPVTSYDVVHEKRLHLIAVREDFAAYHHVHPELGADGTWSVPVDLSAGDWRVYADFQPTGGEAMTLPSRLEVVGDEAPRELPAETTVDEVDGYTVELVGDLTVGGSQLTAKVTRDGVDVTDELVPYLGARGHLVAIRRSDYSYLHVHPDGLTFHTEVPERDVYELFLDFQHDGTVRTAHFTVRAGSSQAGPTESEGPAEGEHHDH